MPFLRWATREKPHRERAPIDHSDVSVSKIRRKIDEGVIDEAEAAVRLHRVDERASLHRTNKLLQRVARDAYIPQLAFAPELIQSGERFIYDLVDVRELNVVALEFREVRV